MPERRRPVWPGLIIALACAALVLAPSGAGHAAPPASPAMLIAQARRDLVRGDGIAAEVRLKQAIEAGASREAVAAAMGEAFVAQGKLDAAREWLEPGRFSPKTAARGFRALGRLEQREGNLAASGRAFDRAIALTPRDATMWVEIGRLRYSGAEHLLALDAADYALELDPANVRALEFRGQIVRDQFGLVAALPWFEAALARAPNDVSVLGEYAATLGELGRAREMLVVTRRMLELDPGNPRAFYLQAVMAARAGNAGLARGLFNRTGGKLADLPGAMLLEGLLEIHAGNYFLAIEALERLAKRQPANARVQDLLARAYFLAGEYREVVRHFSAVAGRPDASPYLLTLVARSHEILGERDQAAPLLDRAANYRAVLVVPVYEGSPIGRLIASGRLAEAEAIVEQDRAANPGSAHAQALAGDVFLAEGRVNGALERYRRAANVRMSESLLQRMAVAYVLSGDTDDARLLVNAFLYQNPTSHAAIRLSAGFSANAGNWRRARLLLEHLKANGAQRDVALLTDLALAQLRDGDAQASEETAREAYRLQRASPVAAQVWGLSLAALGQSPRQAAALLKKARRIMGDTPLLAEGRMLLAANRQG